MNDTVEFFISLNLDNIPDGLHVSFYEHLIFIYMRNSLFVGEGVAMTRRSK